LEERIQIVKDELDLLKQQGLYLEGKSDTAPAADLIALYNVPNDKKSVRGAHQAAKRVRFFLIV
jgi:hypothetical protein